MFYSTIILNTILENWNLPNCSKTFTGCIDQFEEGFGPCIIVIVVTLFLGQKQFRWPVLDFLSQLIGSTEYLFSDSKYPITY